MFGEEEEEEKRLGGLGPAEYYYTNVAYDPYQKFLCHNENITTFLFVCEILVSNSDGILLVVFENNHNNSEVNSYFTISLV